LTGQERWRSYNHKERKTCGEAPYKHKASNSRNAQPLLVLKIQLGHPFVDSVYAFKVRLWKIVILASVAEEKLQVSL